jgi:hypothetical protein
VGPVLQEAGALYKVPRTLRDIDFLNSGAGGYSQVGKCITVYTRDAAGAVELAHGVDAAAGDLAFPEVPFDRQLRPGSCVFYRYGAYGKARLLWRNGTHDAAIEGPSSEPVPDDATIAVPGWVDDPFVTTARPRTSHRHPGSGGGLDGRYRVFAALSQRGKGGVYLALDTSGPAPRQCVLKEGRRHGETDPYGHDGAWRIGNEGRVLRALSRAGVPVPRVLGAFRSDGHRYLALEHLEGPTLEDHVRGRRHLPYADRLRLATELAGLVAGVHAAGIAWRDCKPANVVQTSDGALHPLDFEGAARLDADGGAPWGSRSRLLPPSLAHPGSAPQDEDLHGLGASIAALVCRRAPLRRGVVDVPGDVDGAVTRLLQQLLEPGKAGVRPAAATVEDRLRRAGQARSRTVASTSSTRSRPAPSAQKREKSASPS